MKRVLLFIVYGCCCFKPNLFAQSNAKPKIYAVVVGISSYQNRSLPLLKYADKDAGLFADYLQSEAGGSVPASQIKLLINQNATIAAVYNTLDWLKGHCQNNDLVYIYFSGHGDVETKNARSLGYLLAYNTPPNNYTNNAISVENLNKEANTLTLKNKAKVILITDACHSGKLAGDFFKGKQFVAKQLGLVLNNEVRLAACEANQEAAEGVDWGGGRGVFSYYLLSGLNGFADGKADGKILLGEMNRYLDSCFKADKYLLANRHKQNPVTDGNTNFVLASIDNASFNAIKTAHHSSQTTNSLPLGLQSFATLGTQPVDYFFTQVKDEALENIIKFKSYPLDSVKRIPQKIVNDWIFYVEKMNQATDMTAPLDEDKQVKYLLMSLDTLKLLKDQLQKNEVVISHFNEKFVQLVQDKCQEMINAYITGDLAELERRQYYYAGNRQYDDFLPMVEIALRMIPKDHYLNQVLSVDQAYISGLIARLEMATHSNTDSLLRIAFGQQQKALQLEPYAAYIHNELGNLYFRQHRTDSAAYHFNLASVLSPSWAIPWANKIRLYLAANNLPKAVTAIQKADSLQSGLSFSMMNAGLVMEKTKNLLSSETMYKKSINGNKVHFLPYERLANIYLNTGRYADADYFLFEVETRKKNFKITDDYFKYGVELGGFAFEKTTKKNYTCSMDLDNKNVKLLPFQKLLKVLQNLKTRNVNRDPDILTLNAVLQQVPAMPLANHYLGKLFVEKGEWKAAEKPLLQAIALYRLYNDSTSLVQLTKQLYGNTSDSTNYCLEGTILNYTYDALEDHYLLGKVYEKQGLWEKATAQYKLISSEENQQQNEQAVYKNFSANASYIELNEYVQRYESAIKIGGALKLANLYERLRQYRNAETAWLNQIKKNQDAGFARQLAMERKVPGLWQLTGLDINFYWIAVNRDFEIGIHDFYNRMTALFPRDYYWKERAGLFLYNRLALAYHQMPVTQYQSFSQSINDFKYPWRGDEISAKPDTLETILPGTDEHITTIVPVFDPIKEALVNLQLAAQLSPNVLPKIEVAEAMADLNSWLGNREEAVREYQELIKRQPQNVVFRNKVIDYLSDINDLDGVYQQLNILNQQKKLKPEQSLLLAEYKLLANKNKEARLLLKNYQPKNSIESYETNLLRAKIYWFSGDLNKALLDFKLTVPELKIDAKDDDDLKQSKTQQNIDRAYAIARLYALLHQPEQAFSAVKKALAIGFNCKYVLENDVALAEVKKNPQWQSLLNKYSFAQYDPGITVTPFNPISYRIPNLHSK